MPGHRRTRYIVSRAQVRLLALNVVYYLLLTTTIGVGLWAPLVLGMLDGTTPPEQQQEMAELLLYLHSRLIPVAVALLLFFGLHTVLVSHRIVGPIYRFTLKFREVSRGKLGGRVRLRQRDYLHEEAGELNAMLDGLSTRLRGTRQRFEDLVREWRALEAEIGTGAPSKGRLRMVSALLLRCEAEWTQLDLGPDEQVLYEQGLDDVPGPLPADGRPAVQEGVEAARLHPGR